MGSVSSIVNVQISRQTTVPSRAGFGTGAFVSTQSSFGPYVKSYANLAEMNEDSLCGADAKSFGAKYFGGQLAPTKLTIIRKGSAAQPQLSYLSFSPNVTSGFSVSVLANGIEIGNAIFDTDHATTMGVLATSIGNSSLVSAAAYSSGDDVIQIEFVSTDYYSITTQISGSASVSTVTLEREATKDQTYVEAVDYATTLDNDWYGLAIASRLTADIQAVAAWVQGQSSNNPKLFFAASNDSGILDSASSADVASLLKASSSFRTSLIYHLDATEYIEAAFMGICLPTDAGSITWAYKTLAGITPDALTSSQKSAAHAKSVNTYTTVASVSITEEGKTSDTGLGEFIDVMRGVDWIQANVQADLYTVLVNSPKIPYTSNGIQLIKSTIQDVLQRATNAGILSRDVAFTVTVPDIADVPSADKGTRTLSDVTFQGVLAGAIQKINVQGVVTL